MKYKYNLSTASRSIPQCFFQKKIYYVYSLSHTNRFFPPTSKMKDLLANNQISVSMMHHAHVRYHRWHTARPAELGYKFLLPGEIPHQHVSMDVEGERQVEKVFF